MLIKKLITPCSVPSKSLLLEEGQLANTLYYIKKGCLRLFFCHEGKEITFQFFFEGDFVASFDRPVQTHSQSFLFGKHRACGTSIHSEKGLFPAHKGIPQSKKPVESDKEKQRYTPFTMQKYVCTKTRDTVGMPFPVPVPYFLTDFINFFPFLSRSVFFFISLSSFLVIPFIMIMTKAEKHIQRMFAGFFGTGNFAMRLFPYTLNIIKADNLHIRVRFLPPHDSVIYQ